MTSETQDPLKPMQTPTPGRRAWPLACATWMTGLFGLFGPALADEATSAPPSPTARCTDAAPMPVEQLVGLWQLTLWADQGSPETPVSQGAVLFRPHPEYPGSVRGRLKRTGPGNDLQAVLSGDVVNGEFNLDESDDGVRMSATWVGTPFNCGTRLKGVREPAQAMQDTGTVLQFELRKARE